MLEYDQNDRLSWVLIAQRGPDVRARLPRALRLLDVARPCARLVVVWRWRLLARPPRAGRGAGRRRALRPARQRRGLRGRWASGYVRRPSPGCRTCASAQPLDRRDVRATIGHLDSIGRFDEIRAPAHAASAMASMSCFGWCRGDPSPRSCSEVGRASGKCPLRRSCGNATAACRRASGPRPWRPPPCSSCATRAIPTRWCRPSSRGDARRRAGAALVLDVEAGALARIASVVCADARR